MSNNRPPLNNRNGFIPIRENGTGWLLFRYDPARQLIEVQRRGVKTLVDLTEYAETKVDSSGRGKDVV